jgi:hypothetical protein
VPCSTHSLNLVDTFAAELTNVGNNISFLLLKTPIIFFLFLLHDGIFYQKNWIKSPMLHYQKTYVLHFGHRVMQFVNQ